MKITLDTNILPDEDIISACRELGWDLAVVSVTEREMEGTSFYVCLEPLVKINETGVWDESKWGQCVWGSEKTQADKSDILAIISNESFPSNGRELSKGEHHQLRDAMIFEAHVREGRDIFVTNDMRAFIKAGRRERLQERFDTRIMIREKFLALCDESKY